MIVTANWKREALSMMADKEYRKFQKSNFRDELDLTGCMTDFKNLYNDIQDKPPVLFLDSEKHEWVLGSLMNDLLEYMYWGVD